MRLVVFGLLAFVIQCGLTNAVAASFNCAKASKHVERLICASAQLSDADTALGQAYALAMSSAASPEELRSEQRRWLRDVRDRCLDEACLIEAYRRHTLTLNRVKVSLKAHPPAPVESANGVTTETDRAVVPVGVSIEPIKVLSASPNEFQLEVTGSGPTVQDARADGIRQALQRTVPQIIATERVIKNDSVVMDSVMSSMNGNVKSVDVLSTLRSGNSYEVRMHVHISRRDIVNFVSFRAQSGTNFSGAALLAESQREKEARRFRDTFIERSLRGFPAAASNAKLISLKPDLDPSLVKVQIEYRLDTAFVKALRNAANEVQCVGAKTSCSEYEICTQIGHDDIDCTLPGAGAHQPKIESGYSRFGNYQSLVDTFGLPRSSALPRGNLDFAMRFLDSNGTRVGTQGCYDALMSSVSDKFPLWQSSHIVEIRPRGGGNIIHVYSFSDKPLIYEDKLSLAKLEGVVDLSRIKSIELAPVIVENIGFDRKKGIVFDVVRQPRQSSSKSDPVSPTQNECLWPG